MTRMTDVKKMIAVDRSAAKRRKCNNGTENESGNSSVVNS